MRWSSTTALPLALTAWLVGACTWLVGASASPAQISSEDPVAKGGDDGRFLGRRQGRVLGRAQALHGSFLKGFEQGLAEASAAGVSGRLASEAEEAGRAAGFEAGRSAGALAGQEAAKAAWLAEAAEPFRPPTPKASAAPDPGEAPGCPPPRRVRLSLVRDVVVELELEGLEDAPSPLRVDNFDLPYPAEDELRQRARNSGAVSFAVDDWVRDYKFAFQSAWNDAFIQERSGTPLADLEELRGVGLEEGRREGERRLACRTAPERHRAGFETGWAAGWSAGWDEGWAETNERHGKRGIVVVRDARLRDASGDGLFEPGEGLVLEATLVNAGSEEAQRSAGSYTALRGLEAEGHFEGGLLPGASRAIRVELGTVDAEAPPGTSVVVQVRGLGSEPETLAERLGRPARIEDATARLEVEEGRLIARVAVHVASLSPASARTALRVEAGDEVAELGRLNDRASARVELSVDVGPPEALGAPVTGVLVLRTEDGTPWHAGRWSAPFGCEEAVRLVAAGQGAASGPGAAAVAAMLLEYLRASWAGPAGEGPERDGLPEALEAFASARSALPQARREVLDGSVTRPFLEHVDSSKAPRRLRRLAREQLDG